MNGEQPAAGSLTAGSAAPTAAAPPAATPSPEALAAVALAMIRNEDEGRALAKSAGLDAAAAARLRDRLAREAPLVVGGGLDALRRRLAEQTEELGRLAAIAEEYRTGRRQGPHPLVRRIAPGGLPTRESLPDRARARAWVARRLPPVVKARLRVLLGRPG